MIRALVDFALNNKFVVLAIAVLLLGWGAVSFHNLPVEAYPDIADNYVTVITQWPGRSAEEVEQQVMKRDSPPTKQQDGDGQHHKPVVKRKVYKSADHSLFPVLSP